MMKIGIVGLGRMGENIARRLARKGHSCVVTDIDHGKATALAASVDDIEPATDFEQLVERLAPPRHVWVMIPAGSPTSQVVTELGRLLAPDDVVIDGGNTYYRDDVRRAAALADRGIHLIDVGTSGGIWGLKRGYCLMIGGDEGVVRRLEPVLAALAPGPCDDTITRTPGRTGPLGPEERGYLYCGGVGSGHFAKMVHNAIEYGMMQAYAEGIDLLRAAQDSEPSYELDVPAIAELWRRGSVIPSWLLDLMAAALVEDGQLDGASTQVGETGEGRWALQTAIDLKIPVPVLSAALTARFESQDRGEFANRVLSTLRKRLGGHD